MLVNKSDCKFSIMDHTRLTSNLNLYKMIKMEFEIAEEKFKMFYTNAGWKEDNGSSLFCPKKFYPVQAEKFLFTLKEKILV